MIVCLRGYGIGEKVRDANPERRKALLNAIHKALCRTLVEPGEVQRSANGSGASPAQGVARDDPTVRQNRMIDGKISI